MSGLTLADIKYLEFPLHRSGLHAQLLLTARRTMTCPDATDLCTQASQLAQQLQTKDGELGFMSAAVYDTAWVSMVQKTTPEGRQ